ncbi:hypothetical protein L1049_000780 [Liquidambar formosana]|uniref:Uncharacterized protein n=1 Tax=Liquidambar formosana TaxID=63359 RepID=A0AAP0N9E3_LIQFO
MVKVAISVKKLRLSSLSKSVYFLVVSFYHFVVLRANPFSIELCYFLSLSFLGFWVLKALNPAPDSFTPRNLDLFFTSVSASTVSSMSTVEMEVFSDTQLVVLTVLMFVGGEVFTSMVGLHLRGSNQNKKLWKTDTKVDSVNNELRVSSHPIDQVELGVVGIQDSENSESRTEDQSHIESVDSEYLKCNSIKFLGFVVLGYLLVIHVLGVTLVSLYLTLVSSARDVLKNKGLKLFTFSVFLTVSTFASCGFVPTNENMIVFRKNSGLLLILIPQILFGNTLFPSCLWILLWFLRKSVRKAESNYLLKNTREIGYPHLLPSLHSWLLVATVCGFLFLQFTLFCSMEWNSEGLSGLSTYQKTIGVLFQSANSRHAGETIVDLSIISSAILVLFVVMMYLPPYTSFLPIKDDGQHPQISERRKKRGGKIVGNLILSQLSYLVIFVILICITEREKMKEDPLNFNVLNIVIETVSAYGNVGFTTGYSCKRQLKPDGNCKDKWFGFSGKWSDEGKIVLIVVMFFGRLKKFNMDGGRAWKLL